MLNKISLRNNWVKNEAKELFIRMEEERIEFYRRKVYFQYQRYKRLEFFVFNNFKRLSIKEREELYGTI